MAKDISDGLEKVPVISMVDLEHAKSLKNFEYITHSIIPENLRTQISFYDGCDCETSSCSLVPSCGCLLMHPKEEDQYQRSYNPSSSSVPNKYDLPRFECNSACTCASTCSNRIVQHGITKFLAVILTKNRGFGLITLEDIPKGQFVCEYAGEIIHTDEAKYRWQNKKCHSSNYILVIKEHL